VGSFLARVTSARKRRMPDTLALIARGDLAVVMGPEAHGLVPWRTPDGITWWRRRG